MNHPPSQPVAVVSMGCVLPNSTGVDAYWQLLRSGDRSAQALPPKERWDWRLYNDEGGTEPDKGYSPLGGYIVGDPLDPAAAGLDEHSLRGCGWMERWLIQALVECRAGTAHRGLKEVAYLGGSMPATMGHHETARTLTELMAKALTQRGEIIPHDLESRCSDAMEVCRYPGSTKEQRDLSGQARFAVRAILGNHVPCQVLDAACASSLFAIEHGVRTLRDGTADLAWCGGFFKWGPVGQVLFSRLGGLTSTACTPFDRSADGTIFGDGAGVVALKRLADAERDGDRILGLVSGVGTASDGRGKAVYAPNCRGQVLAMRRAFEDAGLQPRDIDYVIAHATGTPVGDATEYESLVKVYGGSGSRDRGQVVLGSNKGNFGHLGWTAGVASLIQALLALREKEIPPQAGFQEPQSGIDLDRGPFRIITEPEPWKCTSPGPRRVAVSGFGFGGTNAHVLVEEYLGPKPGPAGIPPTMRSPRSQEFCVVAWSAMLPGALGRQAIEENAGTSVGGRFPEAPPFQGHRYRMPPTTQRLADPAQQLLLRATDDLLRQLPAGVLDTLRSRTGVFIASTGAGQMWVSHALRIHRDLVRQKLSSDPELAPAVEDAIAEALARFPQSAEDSFPGLMPNLLAGRISNIFDLHGINEVIDADARSFLAALEIACRSLAQEDLACALVGGSTPIAMDAITPGLTTGDEGAGLIALVSSDTAERLGLPVLARLRIGEPPADPLDPAWNTGDGAANIGSLPNLVGLPEAIDALARGCEMACWRGTDGFHLGPTAQAGDRIRRVDPCVIAQPRWTAVSPPPGPAPALNLRPFPWDENQTTVQVPASGPLYLVIDGRNLDNAQEAGAWLETLCQRIAPLLAAGPEAPNLAIELHHGWLGTGPAAMLEALHSWVLGYRREHPQSRVLLLASASDTLPPGALDSWWPATESSPVVRAWKQGSGWQAPQLIDATLTPSATCQPLGSDGVVLVLGGGSGLGFATARQLARRHGATVVLVGRSPLEPDCWYPDPLPSEGEFLAAGLAQSGGKLNVPARRGLYKYLKAQRERYLRTATLAREGLRWRYERCDVGDPQQVMELVQRVRCALGRIDALVYSVIDTDLVPKRLDSYDPTMFQRMWRSKVEGLSHVLAATADDPPSLVINASSISTLGIEGLVNYAAANAFQGGLLSRWTETTGGRVLNVGWPGWSESGISHRIDPTRTNVDAETTFISDSEGSEFADRMLSDPSLEGTCLLLGAGERKQFASQLGPEPRWEAGPDTLPFVDAVLRQGDTVLVRCTLSGDRDGWLDGHRIGSDPVLPGTGLLELVAEAVQVAVPQRRLWALRDVNFRRFVKLSGGRPITLTVVVRRGEPNGALLRVDVHSDLVQTSGQVLQAGRHHIGTWVETLPLGSVPEAPPHTADQGHDCRRFSVREPYLSGAAGISLGGVFDAMDELTSSATESRGRYRGHLAEATGRLAQGVMPLVLLDGALRLAALCPDANGAMAVFAPVRIGRLTLFQTGGDADWSRQPTPPLARHRFSADGRAGCCEISDGAGRLVMTVEDIQGHRLGEVPWLSPADLTLPPFVRSVLRRSADLIEVLVPIDPDAVPHLTTSAQLHGQTVLPGSWQMALAAEVSGMLRPGWSVAAIFNQSFDSALKLQPGREAPLRVEARVLVDGDDHAHIRCRLLSDMVHPNGTVLKRDRLHGTLEVELQAAPGRLETITPLPFLDDQAEAMPWIPEILYWPHSHLRLGQGFSAIRDARDDGSVIECRYRNPAPLPELLGQLRLSPLLLDAMLQPVLPRHGRAVVTGIPKAIRAVRFAANFNEIELRQQWGELIVRAQGDTDEGSGTRITVSTPQGQGLISVEGFETYTLGAIDIPSGRPLADTSPATLAALKKDDYALPQRWRRTWAPACIVAGAPRRPLAEGRVARMAVGRAAELLPSPTELPLLSADSTGFQKLGLLLEHGLDRVEVHLDAGSLPDDDDPRAWPELADTMGVLHRLSTLLLPRQSLLIQVVVHRSTPTASLAHTVMGWCRSLAKERDAELRDLCRCWLVEGLPSSSVLADLADDARHRLPFSDAVQWRNSQGVHTAHLVQENAVAADPPPLCSDDVVLITGGTGGIGLAAADALHRRYGCRLVLVGRTIPAAPEATLPERGAYAAEWRADDSSRSVAGAMAAFAALRRSLQIRDAVAALKARGARVEAMSADLVDPEATRTLVSEVLQRHGRVDAVIHLAGIDQSSATVTKHEAIFRKVLAAKVASSLALFQALEQAGSLPRVWMHGSSIMATIGMAGQTDYAAANGWLESFHHFLLSQRPGCRSILTEWTAWGGTGMLATRPELWLTTRQLVGQRLGPEMGARLLINELEALPAGPDPVLIVHPLPLETHFQAERRLNGPPMRPLLLDQVRPLGDRGWEGVCHLSPERHRQLAAHSTDGGPSLPGSFELALAVDLLRQVLPAWRLCELMGVETNRFVKVPAGNVLPVRLRARLTQATPETVGLDLELVSDFVHRSGRVIDRDRCHWSARALLRASLPEAPEPAEAGEPCTPVLEVVPAHYQPGARINYSEDLRSLQRRSVDALGHAWGETAITGWEASHPLTNVLILSDAVGLTPCVGSVAAPALQVNSLTESIRCFEALERPLDGGRVITHAWPCEAREDGQSLCPRLEVRNGRGELLILVSNAWLSDYGSGMAASSSLARSIHQVGT